MIMIKRLDKSRIKNHLVLIPVKNNTGIRERKRNGHIEVILPRNGLMDRLVRFFKNTPEFMSIQLDDRGSYVWQAIDGSRTIEEIGNLLNAEFGERVEPVYERLAIFLQILRNNGFISFCYPTNEMKKVIN